MSWEARLKAAHAKGGLAKHCFATHLHTNDAHKVNVKGGLAQLNGDGAAAGRAPLVLLNGEILGD